MSKQIYAIGDTHGELDLLKNSVAKIDRDGGTDAQIVFLGDYVDRGPNSRGVIEFLANGLETGKNWTCLLGNHDQMFRLFMEEAPRNDMRLRIRYSWLHDRLGGKETLASYGVNVDDDDTLLKVHTLAQAAVPQAHLEFLAARPYFHQAGPLLFVHAGVRPSIPLEQQDPDDLIWIRDEFHRVTEPHPWLVVHGHTPVLEAQHYGNRINIDTGSGYGAQQTTVVFEGTDCWLLTETGRVALPPAS